MSYSGKHKKQALQEKRQRKAGQQQQGGRHSAGNTRSRDDGDGDDDEGPRLAGSARPKAPARSAGPGHAASGLVTSFGGSGDAPGTLRLATLFEKEAKEAVQARRDDGSRRLDFQWRKEPAEYTTFARYCSGGCAAASNGAQCTAFLPYPVRPDWDRRMSKHSLEMREAEYFECWRQDTHSMLQAFAERRLRPPLGGSGEDKEVGAQPQPVAPDASESGSDAGSDSDASPPPAGAGARVERPSAAPGPSLAEIIPFEQNLDVWREFWRTIEQSHVVCAVGDARNPGIDIPPQLIGQVLRAGKSVAIILTKADLVPTAQVGRWRTHFTELGREVWRDCCAREGVGGPASAGEALEADGASDDEADALPNEEAFHRRFRVFPFTTNPFRSAQEQDEFVRDSGPAARRKRLQGKGANITPKDDRKRLLKEQLDAVVDFAQATPAVPESMMHTEIVEETPRLVLGCVGRPNVGKSSFLNMLIGQKRLSVSRTAGHTKHVQHIYVQEPGTGGREKQRTRPQRGKPRGAGGRTHQTPGKAGGDDEESEDDDADGDEEEDVDPARDASSQHACGARQLVVMDCPGLVFPQRLPRFVFEVAGMVPLAQMRETMSALRFLAECLPLEKTLAIKKPDWYEDEEEWSPLMVAEAYAEKHSYLLARSGAPDVHRAGLEIMRDVQDGALPLHFGP